MKTLKLFLFLFLFLFSSGTAFTQGKYIIEDIIKFQAVPSDPVLDLLGVEQGNIGKPGTIKKFLASVTSASNIKGELINGVAISVSPYQLLKGENISLDKYVNSPWERIKTNTMLSIGTAPSKSDDGSLKWGLGLKVQILNSGDGRVDPKNIEKLRKIAEEIFSDPLGLTQDQIDELNSIDDKTLRAKKRAEILASQSQIFQTKIMESNNKADKLIEESKKQSTSKPNWNAQYLDLNFGIVFTAANSQIKESSFDRSRFWINGGLGLGKFAQLMFQSGLYKIDKVDSLRLSFAVMTRVGTETFRIGFGASKDNVSIDKGILGIAGEMQISESAWLVFSLDGNVEKGKTPIWVPSGGIKTSLGNFIF